MAVVLDSIILHHYYESMYSEKVRLLLGYKNSNYLSVVTSPVMPRPELTPLTGGYRRIPVMQIGADIYCDSRVICRKIDQLYPENPIYSQQLSASMDGYCNWLETSLFRAAIALRFQPSAIASEPLFAGDLTPELFWKDRAELSAGSSRTRVPLDLAEQQFNEHLHRLEEQFSSCGDFLFGEKPMIADFSLYHVLWLVAEREPLANYFADFPALMAWYHRMAAFGHGRSNEISAQRAYQDAVSATPEPLPGVTKVEILAGAPVSVFLDDAGDRRITGVLRHLQGGHIAIARNSPELGDTCIHLPTDGLKIEIGQ